MFHVSLFETKAVAVHGDVVMFFIDFGTTGLEVPAAEALEIGVTEARFLSSFLELAYCARTWAVLCTVKYLLSINPL